MTNIERLEKELKSHVDTIKSLESLIECHTKSKEKIEELIAEEKRRSTFAYALDRYKSYGDYHTYIRALEACRPWVIKSKLTGSFAIHSVTRKTVLFATKEDASEYNERTGSSGWEVVQWEGNE
jgi:hypothetical protein